MDPKILFDQLAGYLCVVVIITVHEFGHAWAAVRLGDDTPRLQGRVTLNPLAHPDPIGTVALPIIAALLTIMGTGLGGFIIGWGRPVEFNETNLRNRQTGPLLIAMAGPLMNVVLAVIVMALARLSGLAHVERLLEPCVLMAEISMFLFFFNLLPIPPLDGSYILKHVTDMSWETFHNFSRFGMIALIIAIQLQPVRAFLGAATALSLHLIARLVGLQ